MLRVSGKTSGSDLLVVSVPTLPTPPGLVERALGAMIFHSVYDTYRGVITYVRMFDGR